MGKVGCKLCGTFASSAENDKQLEEYIFFFSEALQKPASEMRAELLILRRLYTNSQ